MGIRLHLSKPDGARDAWDGNLRASDIEASLPNASGLAAAHALDAKLPKRGSQLGQPPPQDAHIRRQSLPEAAGAKLR